MYVFVSYILESTSLSISSQRLLTICVFPIFLIVCFGISVSFRYFSFVSVNLGTDEKLVCVLILAFRSNKGKQSLFKDENLVSRNTGTHW